MLNHIKFLAQDIGPRGTGTSSEVKAADYVSDRLKEWDIIHERLTCCTILSMNHYPLSINSMGLLALLLFPLNGVWCWIAAFLALLVAPFMALTIRTSANPLRLLLPKVSSPTILGRIEPWGMPKHQVVLLSHLDTNRCRLTWKPEVLHRLEPLTYLTLGMQSLFGFLLLLGVINGHGLTFWFLALIPGVYMFAMIVTLVLDDQTPYSPGANDNASSVGVVLNLAERLAKQPLTSTRVWVAFTGAEETDHYGLRSILNAYPQEMRDSLFIDHEGVGGGEIIYITRHGIGLHYFPDQQLLEIAGKVAAENSDLHVRGKKMTVSEEVSTLTHLRYRAICIAGHDPQTGGLAHWHQANDTVVNIDSASLKKARDFTLAMLKEIDAR